MISSFRADQLIPEMANNLEFKKRGVTKDIISVMIWCSERANHYTKNFASSIKIRTKRDLYDLWMLVKHHIRYRADEEGREIVKSPAALWHLRKKEGGDCKSFSIFIKSICSNLGLPGGYRFVAWKDGSEVTHVYPYVILNNEKCFMDAVPGARFDKEVDYAYHVDIDWNTKKMIAGIGNINNAKPSLTKLVFWSGLTIWGIKTLIKNGN